MSKTKYAYLGKVAIFDTFEEVNTDDKYIVVDFELFEKVEE